MFKKYKIKKRKKALSTLYIFIIFSISLLFVTYGYALFSDSQTINGTVTFKDPSGGDIEYGNSTYKWQPAYEWVNGDNMYVYAVQIDIVNLDEDYYSDKSIEISFDVPDGCVLDDSININIWQKETVKLEGNTITVKFTQNDSWLLIGETLTIYPHLYFENPTDVTITNLIFAGKRANLVEQ